MLAEAGDEEAERQEDEDAMVTSNKALILVGEN
jgi:hypothetical protein